MVAGGIAFVLIPGPRPRHCRWRGPGEQKAAGPAGALAAPLVALGPGRRRPRPGACRPRAPCGGLAFSAWPGTRAPSLARAPAPVGLVLRRPGARAAPPPGGAAAPVPWAKKRKGGRLRSKAGRP